MKKIVVVCLSAFLFACVSVQNREEPQVVSWVEPIFPADAAANCVEGYIVGSLEISEKGTVSAVQIVESYPPGVFENSVQSAWMGLQYLPKIVDGKPEKYSGKLIQTTFLQDEPCSDPARVDLSALDPQYKALVDAAKFGDAKLVVRARLLGTERLERYFVDTIEVMATLKNETDLQIPAGERIEVLSYSSHYSPLIGEATLYLVPMYHYGIRSDFLVNRGIQLVLIGGRRDRGASHMSALTE